VTARHIVKVVLDKDETTSAVNGLISEVLQRQRLNVSNKR
jgi:hypothetical protein